MRWSWFYFGLLIKVFWKCWAWSIHNRCRFYEHDIMPSTIHRSAESGEATSTGSTVGKKEKKKRKEIKRHGHSLIRNELDRIHNCKLWKWVFSTINCEDQCYVTLNFVLDCRCYPELWVNHHILTELIFQSTADKDLWLKYV